MFRRGGATALGWGGATALSWGAHRDPSSWRKPLSVRSGGIFKRTAKACQPQGANGRLITQASNGAWEPVQASKGGRVDGLGGGRHFFPYRSFVGGFALANSSSVVLGWLLG